MKQLLLIAMLIFATINVSAQPNTNMEGSHWVQFQPMQSDGNYYLGFSLKPSWNPFT
jgi:hypothetical protein